MRLVGSLARNGYGRQQPQQKRLEILGRKKGDALEQWQAPRTRIACSSPRPPMLLRARRDGMRVFSQARRVAASYGPPSPQARHSAASCSTPAPVRPHVLPAQSRPQLRVLCTLSSPKGTHYPYFSSFHLRRTRHTAPSAMTTQTQTQTRSHAGHSHHHHHDNTFLLSKNKNDAGVRITRIGLYVNLGMAISKGFGGYVFNSQGEWSTCSFLEGY